MSAARTTVAGAVAGLVFGLGLVVSGMANPAKVLGFLDLLGAWDPSLAFVMVGAIAVAAPAFALERRRVRSPAGAPPAPAQRVDGRLVAGSLVFGVGWGLVGFCPGPALVAVGLGVPQAVGFVLAMLAGMATFEVAEARRGRRRAGPEARAAKRA